MPFANKKPCFGDSGHPAAIAGKLKKVGDAGLEKVNYLFRI
jgi:hypothetical protein